MTIVSLQAHGADQTGVAKPVTDTQCPESNPRICNPGPQISIAEPADT